MNKESVLVTGGAGYIGSHVVYSLLETGKNVIVLDDLSCGGEVIFPENVLFIKGDFGNQELVYEILKNHNCLSVMHFAGSIVVLESMQNPLKYYLNNTVNSINLIKACVKAKVRNFVYSSTAAVYGNPSNIPVAEDDIKQPINPYGSSKLAFEWVLKDVASAEGINYGVLRYFNVAGADPKLRSGQKSKKATHLIKVACQSVLSDKRQMSVYGNDYPTPDGTCIRDYIHVSDLADIHVEILNYLKQENKSTTFNCGYGRGFSVLEVLQKVQEVSGVKLNIKNKKRRPGDPPQLIADVSKLMNTIDWRPKHRDLEVIIKTALDWEKTLL